LLGDLKVRVFADGAGLDGIRECNANPLIAGFTTNPTLMRQAGVQDYEWFARQVLELVPDRPVSFEVIGDEPDEIERQALKLHAWGDNVFVKVPVMNTKRELHAELVRRLTDAGVHVNVTAVMSREQVEVMAAALNDEVTAFVSVFAGRIADTGRDPVPVMQDCLKLLESKARCQLIWASPREVLNIFQADAIGCHVITVTHDLLAKLSSVGKDLDQFSLETVQMFERDAVAAGYVL
jgi:transaldolase